MTCIVVVKDKPSGRVVMACDSQASHNGVVMTHALPKIVKRNGFLFGADGPLWLGNFYRYGDLPERPRDSGPDTMTLPQWCSERLAPWLREAATQRNQWRDIAGGKEFGGQTLVALGSEFVLMDSGGSVLVPAHPWWAIGSGGSEARGALAALASFGHLRADERAAVAVAAAIALDDGCCEPIREEWTNAAGESCQSNAVEGK